MLEQVERGRRLRELRTAQKLTQKQIAEAIGITDSAVGQWENGKTNPSWTQLAALDHLLAANGEVMRMYGLVVEPHHGRRPDDDGAAIPAFVWNEFQRLEQELSDLKGRVTELEAGWRMIRIPNSEFSLAADVGRPTGAGGEEPRTRPSPEPELEGP